MTYRLYISYMDYIYERFAKLSLFSILLDYLIITFPQKYLTMINLQCLEINGFMLGKKNIGE